MLERCHRVVLESCWVLRPKSVHWCNIVSTHCKTSSACLWAPARKMPSLLIEQPAANRCGLSNRRQADEK